MTILNSIDYYGYVAAGVMIWAIIVFIICCVIEIFLEIGKRKGIPVYIVICSMIIAGIVSAILNHTPTKRYEVIFDNECSAIELLTNYTVVNQRGDIFIIEEKND